ncbi:LD-carboxypeptidase [Mycoplasma sp. Pen4]|uniref:S66 family peptidase n=1 Tax=Mycoplasma sp. Pen4 TaxID=640330 RepID=UPI001653F38C|nr:S66 peptidase family protein [Mycoplasma sp. Pen4]QNM93790.1 LD-carboxypeptidase [Mycoplasma sp. Pen4]
MKLKANDLIRIISLSAGILGEDFCQHQLELGLKRIDEYKLQCDFSKHALDGMEYIEKHPEARAKDLVEAFQNPNVKAILCALGGNDTFKTVPYILDDPEAVKIIKNNPKFFIGYSDTTINHLMLNKLGLKTYYGLAFLTCIAELYKDMLSYTSDSFWNLFTDKNWIYKPASKWYFERTDFSAKQLNSPRKSLDEKYGYIHIQGKKKFQGKLIGGCLESIAELISGNRYPEEAIINQKYDLFTKNTDFDGKILLLETSEEKLKPEVIEQYLEIIASIGVFKRVTGVIIGKPQDEVYFNEYMQVYSSFFSKYDISVVYNINVGHAYPKMLLELGSETIIDVEKQTIEVIR